LLAGTLRLADDRGGPLVGLVEQRVDLRLRVRVHGIPVARRIGSDRKRDKRLSASFESLVC
jgi:hypothetical protein